MKVKIYLIILYTIFLVGCNTNNESDSHIHEADEITNHDHSTDHLKIQLLSYTDKYELFAEADPFIIGEKSSVLAHFTILPDFKPLDKGIIMIQLKIEGKIIKQVKKRPTRTGIYNFSLTPETTGKGEIVFTLISDKNKHKIIISDIVVFETKHDAIHFYESDDINNTNTTAFTKEQSWKINFSTGLPFRGEFGQTIKTTAKIQPSLEDEVLILAKTNGIVMQSNGNIHAGTEVFKNQVLFNISGNSFAEDNASIRYQEAKNNYETAKAEYDRHVTLIKDKIVSEKDMLAVKNEYKNTKAIFENLDLNFNSGGQKVKSPLHGYITELYFQNGQYVESGSPLVRVSQNKHLSLHGGVQQKYANILDNVKSANIRTLHDGKTYTMEELDGKIISYGKTTNQDNYLIPVCLEIENKFDLLPGSFVEIYLKAITNKDAIYIPNTSLIEEQGNFFVFVQVTPELFEKREVSIGGDDGLNSEILIGINETERIVTKGAMLIKLSQATGTLDAHSGHVH